MGKQTTTATEKHVGMRARSGDMLGAVETASVKRPATGKGKLVIGKRKVKTGAKPRTVAFEKTAPAAFYRATGLERVHMIRQGVPAIFLDHIAKKMDIPKERLFATLRFSRSTVDRKIQNDQTLSAEYSERVIGLERLIGQVEVMVAQSGNPKGFDADRWVGEWLQRPLPALGGAKPADLMDTMEGQELVSRLLAQSQSGAYV